MHGGRVIARGAVARRRAGSAQRGIALIAVLWLTVLLTVIASSLAYSMRGEAMSARNALSLAQARAAADGGDRADRIRAVPPARQSRGLVARRRVADLDRGRRRVSASRQSTRRRSIDLNVGHEALLKGLLTTVGGADADTVQRVFDAISDWRDPDDLKRPNGAEAADYLDAGRKYKPANGPFESVGELRRVLGMTPELYARMADSLTVYSRQPGINAATASRDVLLAVPGATPEAVDAFLQQRAQALADRHAAADVRRPRPRTSARSSRRLANPRRGDDARWCNLRPRRGAAPVRRRAPARRQPALAGGRAGRRRDRRARQPGRHSQ